MPVMLDLFCGLGGASAAMRERGWTVIALPSDLRRSRLRAIIPYEISYAVARAVERSLTDREAA